jgi:hypothetical protein
MLFMVWLPFVANIFCGSVQSLGVMALVLVCGSQLSSRASSGDFGGGGIRCWMAFREDAETPKDFYVISMFCRSLCVGWLLSLYPCYMHLSMYVYFSLQSNIDTRIIKKKSFLSLLATLAEPGGLAGAMPPTSQQKKFM